MNDVKLVLLLLLMMLLERLRTHEAKRSTQDDGGPAASSVSASAALPCPPISAWHRTARRITRREMGGPYVGGAKRVTSFRHNRSCAMSCGGGLCVEHGGARDSVPDFMHARVLRCAVSGRAGRSAARQRPGGCRYHPMCVCGVWYAVRARDIWHSLCSVVCAVVL